MGFVLLRILCLWVSWICGLVSDINLEKLSITVAWVFFFLFCLFFFPFVFWFIAPFSFVHVPWIFFSFFFFSFRPCYFCFSVFKGSIEISLSSEILSSAVFWLTSPSVIHQFCYIFCCCLLARTQLKKESLNLRRSQWNP